MIDKLEMFIALAREEHFGKAAESLGITQPSLSSGIKQLEGQLGVQLVWRGSRYAGLTPEGQRALFWARRIVSDARTFRDYRRLFDAVGNEIDAVLVSTTDFMHAPIALAAMDLGKHVYCQKPLSQNLKLLDGSRAIDIRGYQAWRLLFPFEPSCKLGCGGRFTRPLQADQHQGYRAGT